MRRVFSGASLACMVASPGLSLTSSPAGGAGAGRGRRGGCCVQLAVAPGLDVWSFRPGCSPAEAPAEKEGEPPVSPGPQARRHDGQGTIADAHTEAPQVSDESSACILGRNEGGGAAGRPAWSVQATSCTACGVPPATPSVASAFLVGRRTGIGRCAAGGGGPAARKRTRAGLVGRPAPPRPSRPPSRSAPSGVPINYWAVVIWTRHQLDRS